MIIDSEGIGALNEDTNHDNRIFSLALLLSSFFIYNSVGIIDENAIENLSLIIKLTKNIQIFADLNRAVLDEDDYSKFFPKFLWILRDFSLQLIDQEGEKITANEYLRNALKPQKGFSDDIENKNRIRRLLQLFFSERDCATLIRPLTNEKSLQKLHELDIEKLRPEFYQQINSLRDKILGRMKPKSIDGVKLDGIMLAELLISYVNAINQGAVPVIKTAWNYICKNECDKAISKAIELYDALM